MSTITPVTAEQLLRMNVTGESCELIRGEVHKVTPVGWKHGIVSGKLHGLLWKHVEQHDLGFVFAAETGFWIERDPDTVRGPDIAFIHKDHFPELSPTEAYWPGSPDLAVEVLSPDNRPKEVEEKARGWLRGGAKLVWVIDPTEENARVYSESETKTLDKDDLLDGEDVVPGFRCRIGDLFPYQ